MSVGGTVLVVDDEADLRRLLQFNLNEAGFTAETAATGLEGLVAAERCRPSVVVLDLMLPDVPGTEVCRRLRANPALADIGILMLTARNDDYDRIVGFELGCDDYVVKPFNVAEVMLRVRALARRVGERREKPAALVGKTLRLRALRVDTARHRVDAGDKEIVLRPLEFRLLVVLLENAGAVLSRERLLAEVWDGDVNPRTVDTHIKRLRQRLGEHGDCVETVVGFGYRVPDA